MTLQWRLYVWWSFIWGFLSNGTPVYYRTRLHATFIRIARYKYDPWTDTKTLVIKLHSVERVLQDDGKADGSDEDRWMYVNKSRRTMQKLQHG
jgi:hypothetical protein